MSELTVGFLFLFSIFSIVFWWVCAVFITGEERSNLLFATEGACALYGEWLSVSDDRHLVFVLLFRSRRTLYPKIYAAMEGNGDD